jgi:hypothetical protein
MKITIFFFFLFIVFISVTGCRVQNNPPELISLSAKNNSVYVGDDLTLTGYQFGSNPSVTVGTSTSAVSAPISTHDENTITIKIPVVPPGATQVRVRNDQGVSDPLPLVVIQPAPASVVVTPTNALPGSTVVITGNYLNQLKLVRFDNLAAVVQDSSVQKLTVIVPPNAPRGPSALAIETQGGQFVTNFIVAGTPKITSVTPRQTKPGAELVIQGVNLLDGIVTVNGKITEKQLTTVKDTEIRTIVPAEATSGKVTVTVFGSLSDTSADSVKIIQQPFISSLSARDGITGDKITLTGRNLRDVTSVSFGSVAATFRVVSDTQIEATVPAIAAPIQLTVSAISIGGNASATDPFFYYVAPSNVVVTPARQLRSRAITVSGKNLYRITDVLVNGKSVPITSRNEGTDLLVDVPVDGTSGPVTVVNRAGSATTTTPLVVVQKPVVTSIVQDKARPGDRVVILGDFLLNASIYFTGSNTPAADGGRNTDTERWVIVPAAAQTGPLRVTNATNDDTTTPSVTIIRLITNVDFSPKSGKAGDAVIISGDNILSIRGVQFSNGTSTFASITGSGNGIKVIVPPGATTGQICLTNEAGTTCTTVSFTVTP